MTRLCIASIGWLAMIAAADADPIYSIKDLTPEGYRASVAFDINADGDVVGVATRFFTGGGSEEAFFVYDSSTGVSTPFGVGSLFPRESLFSGVDFRRAAINDAGLVVGTARFLAGSTESRGFVYDGASITSLGTFFQSPGTGSNIRPGSDAMDINESGVVVGNATSGRASSDNSDIYASTAAPISDLDGDVTAATRGDRGRAINASWLDRRIERVGQGDALQRRRRDRSPCRNGCGG